MNGRRMILIVCVIFSLILFADGITVLPKLNVGRQSEFVEEKEPQTGIVYHEESSISLDAPINLMILGLDEEELRTDVILLLNYSPYHNKLNILSVARDTRVFLKGSPRKINSLYSSGGVQQVVQRLEKLTDLKIDYYITMNLKGFREIIDTLGGVKFNISDNLDYDDPTQNLHIHLKKGLQVLDGEKAEQFIRYRKGNNPGEGYEDADIGRIKAQQDFIRELISQKLKLRYLTKLDDVYFILREHMKTNVQIGDIRKYASDLINLQAEDIKAFTMPGDSKYIDRTWYYIHNPKKTARIIETNFFK